jgi:hypothetical protein
LKSDGSIIVVGTGYSTSDGSGHPFLMRFFPYKPQIGSFTANPHPVVAGADLMLTAANVVDLNPGGSVVQVAFYQDANGDGILQAGTDLLLGYGTQTSPGTWSLTYSTTGLTSGTYTFFAQVLDNHSLFSDPLATSDQVL